MSGVHGAPIGLVTARCEDVPLRRLVAVPVDVGKTCAAVMACDFTGRRLLGAHEFALTRDGVHSVLGQIRAALPADVAVVRAGVEAAGHYHLPLVAPGVWPAGWELVELNPAHVTAQRRVNGHRGVKTDLLTELPSSACGRCMRCRARLATVPACDLHGRHAA